MTVYGGGGEEEGDREDDDADQDIHDEHYNSFESINSSRWCNKDFNDYDNDGCNDNDNEQGQSRIWNRFLSF